MPASEQSIIAELYCLFATRSWSRQARHLRDVREVGAGEDVMSPVRSRQVLTLQRAGGAPEFSDGNSSGEEYGEDDDDDNVAIDG